MRIKSKDNHLPLKYVQRHSRSMHWYGVEVIGASCAAIIRLLPGIAGGDTANDPTGGLAYSLRIT